MLINKIGIDTNWILKVDYDTNAKNPRVCEHDWDKNTWNILSFGIFKKYSPDKHEYKNFYDCIHDLTGISPQELATFSPQEIKEIALKHGYFLEYLYKAISPFFYYRRYDNKAHKKHLTIAYTKIDNGSSYKKLLDELETELYIYNCYINGFVYKHVFYNLCDDKPHTWIYDRYFPHNICTTEDITKLLLDEYSDGYLKNKNFVNYEDLKLTKFVNDYNG